MALPTGNRFPRNPVLSKPSNPARRLYTQQSVQATMATGAVWHIFRNPTSPVRAGQAERVAAKRREADKANNSATHTWSQAWQDLNGDVETSLLCLVRTAHQTWRVSSACCSSVLACAWRSQLVLGRCAPHAHHSAHHRLHAGGREPLRATKTLTGLCLLMIAVACDDLVEGLQFAEICASVSSARARRRALDSGFAVAASHASRLSQ